MEIKSIHEIIQEISPYYKKRGKPETEHLLRYDSASETLEPIYFFLLDLMSENFGYDVEKLVDNFSSSSGSGNFSEIGQRAVVMQQQADNSMKTIYSILRGILNLLYDLKEFKIRLQSYKDFHSKEKKEAATLSLKQIWIDKVDMLKGNSSIAMMARQLGFETLFDAFYVAKDEKDAERLDLNERVKRLIKQRIFEFNSWVKQSEKELTKRYELERNYLKNQVNSLKLNIRWLKPYLKAAQQLEMKDQGHNPNLVKTFSTTIFELTLFGKSKINIKDKALDGDLPAEFAKDRFLNSIKRDYYKCVLIDFNFRGIPQKVSQRGDYVFGGKAEVTFRGYALNNEELDKLKQEIEKSELNDALSLIEGMTTDSLEKMQGEINEFLEEKDEEKDETNKKSNDTNPFLALIGYYDKKQKKQTKQTTKKQKEIIVKPDNFIEKEHLRPLTATNAKDDAFDLFDAYKGAHKMESYT